MTPGSALLPSTGECAVLPARDLLTEAREGQRYAYFRPWYAGAKVVEAGCGEGSGVGYAALFAAEALGLDDGPQAVFQATGRYPRASFATADLTAHDYAQADLALAFDVVDRLADPRAFLSALGRCPGTIVVSTSNPLLGASAFADLVRELFEGRRVRFLSQEDRWPGLIREGFDPQARNTIAVVDGGELPHWPRIGLAMPCCGEATAAALASTRLAMHYPGELEIALVAQGCDEAALRRLRSESAAAPHVVHLIERDRNLGYGGGANVGLGWLRERCFDLYGVTNDDVVPAPDCLPQLAAAVAGIIAAGHSVGMIGPVSNQTSGDPRVDIGPYGNLDELRDRALAWGAERHSHVDSAIRVGGPLMLISPDCLDAVGGFDPLFGSFEDDDLSLRARTSGFGLWVAPGAFLHHAGASSFRRLEIDPEDGTIRNLALFLEKWDAEDLDEAFSREALPPGIPARIEFDAQPPRSGHLITIDGAPVDLVYQASEFDLAAWIVTKLRDKPREARGAILDALNRLA